jgi:hypothetical protein
MVDDEEEFWFFVLLFVWTKPFLWRWDETDKTTMVLMCSDQNTPFFFFSPKKMSAAVEIVQETPYELIDGNATRKVRPSIFI